MACGGKLIKVATIVFPPSSASDILATISQHEANQAGLVEALRDKTPSFGQTIFQQN